MQAVREDPLMGEVPSYTWWDRPDAPSQRTITVLPLRENKRPVGFAPWPDEEVAPPKNMKNKLGTKPEISFKRKKKRK